ncbi:MOSC domain-containing protein [Bacillus sp. OTU530]|uniref:MOSC domain-containing protein n=1 Tax=Bacillus sp. OTU530 TaxID=3043862 RepID=UPI00313E09C5
MKLLQISVGLPKTKQLENGTLVTGIGKEEVEGCWLRKESFDGDAVANTSFHGGVDRAVCVYPFEHYALWEKQFGSTLPRPAFGENFTVIGMKEEDTYIGDVYRIGEAIVQVTQGRIPCITIDQHTGCKGLMAEIVKTGYTGYFMRVLEEGFVDKDASITLLERGKSVTVLHTNRIYFHGPWNEGKAKEILAEEALAPAWRNKLVQRITKNR